MAAPMSGKPSATREAGTRTRVEAPYVPLESGDRLTRKEFHLRYSARPDIKKAELVRGVVYVASPVRFVQHGEPHALVLLWLGTYVALHPELTVATDSTVFIAVDSEVQPDAALFRRTGGSLAINDRGYLEGSPELVVEVAASSASYDLHDKKGLYRDASVPEYVVWQALERRIDWFRLDRERGVYVPLPADERGVIASVEFPGLRLAVPAMLNMDRAGVLAALQEPR